MNVNQNPVTTMLRARTVSMLSRANARKGTKANSARTKQISANHSRVSTTPLASAERTISSATAYLVLLENSVLLILMNAVVNHARIMPRVLIW